MPPKARPKKSNVAQGSTRPSPGLASPSNPSQADHLSRRPSGIVKKTSSHQQGVPKRRVQVRHACLHCRTDKVKCSGTHPVCSRCNARSLLCSWDVPEEGITKTQHLQLKLAEQGARLDRVNAMVHILRHGSDKVATEALARLRIGESLDEVLQIVGAKALSASDPDQMKPDQMEQVLGTWLSNEPAYDPLLVQPNQYPDQQERASA